MNVQPRASQQLNNQSSVRFVSGDADGVAYSNMVSIPLTGAILTLTKSASVEQVSLDSIVMYQLEIGNIGNVEAEVTLFDTLPEGTSFIPNSLLRDGVPLPGVGLEQGLPLGIIPIGTKMTILFQIIVSSIPKSLSLTNQALVRYTFQTLDGRFISRELSSNRVTISVSPSLLSVYYYASTNQTFEGDILTFFVQITNAGREAIRNALLRVSLVGDMSFIPGSVVIDGLLTPDLDPSEGMILPYVSANGTVEIVYQVRVGKNIESVPLSSHVTLVYRSQEKEIVIRSNQVSISRISPLLSMAVTITPVEVTYEDTLTYDVLIQNEGDIPAEAVYDISLLAGLTLVPGSVKLNGIARPESSLVNGLTLGTLFPRSGTSITFNAKVSLLSNTSPPVVEMMNRSGLTYTFRLNDGRAVRLTSMTLTPVFFYAPRILLQVTAVPTFVELGDNIVFEITIHNVGNTETGITIPLPVPWGSNILYGYIQSQDRQREFTLDEIKMHTVQISNIEPNELIQINYSLRLSNVQSVSFIRGRKGEVWRDTIKALCTYYFNERLHSFEVQSNVYELYFTEHEE